MYKRVYFSKALSGGALSQTIAIDKDCYVASAYFTFSSSASDSVYFAIDALEGSTYDCRFKTLTVSSNTYLAWAADGVEEFILTKGDNLVITSTAVTTAATLYGVVILKTVD